MQERARLVAGDAVAARELERGLDELRPGARREAAMHFLEACEQAGHRDRAVADVEDLCARVLEVDQHLVHLAEPLRRSREEAVEERRLAPWLVQEDEAAARGPGQRPLGDERREGGGKQRVDGVPSLAQNAPADFGAQRVAGRNRSTHRLRVLPGQSF